MLGGALGGSVADGATAGAVCVRTVLLLLLYWDDCCCCCGSVCDDVDEYDNDAYDDDGQEEEDVMFCEDIV